MDMGNPTPDGIAPPQDSPITISDIAEVTKTIHKFKCLEIRDRSAAVNRRGNPEPTLIAKQFESLHISDRVACQQDNRSAQATVAGQSRAHPRTGPVDTDIDGPTQASYQNSIYQPEDDLGELTVSDDNLEDLTERLTMKLQADRRGKRWMRAGRRGDSRKTLSKGPTRNKIGGVSRHRQTASGMAREPALPRNRPRNRISGPGRKKGPSGRVPRQSSSELECLTKDFDWMTVDIDMDRLTADNDADC